MIFYKSEKKKKKKRKIKSSITNLVPHALLMWKTDSLIETFFLGKNKSRISDEEIATDY